MANRGATASSAEQPTSGPHADSVSTAATPDAYVGRAPDGRRVVSLTVAGSWPHSGFDSAVATLVGYGRDTSVSVRTQAAAAAAASTKARNNAPVGVRRWVVMVFGVRSMLAVRGKTPSLQVRSGPPNGRSGIYRETRTTYCLVLVVANLDDSAYYMYINTCSSAFARFWFHVFFQSMVHTRRINLVSPYSRYSYVLVPCD
eukprot:SAG11_NODE_2292_length_3556_cov_4.475557_1_plen_201_part_00